MMYWFMSRCHNKDVIFALKMSLLSQRHLMTVVINMHFIFIICHVVVMKASCQSYAHPLK